MRRNAHERVQPALGVFERTLYYGLHVVLKIAVHTTNVAETTPFLFRLRADASAMWAAFGCVGRVGCVPSAKSARHGSHIHILRAHERAASVRRGSNGSSGSLTQNTHKRARACVRACSVHRTPRLRMLLTAAR